MSKLSNTFHAFQNRKVLRFSPAVLPLVSAILLLVSRLLDDVLLSGDGIYLSVVVLQIIIFLLPAGIQILLRGEGYLSRLRLKPAKLETLLLSLSSSVILISGGLLLSMLFSGIGSLPGTFTLYETFRTDEGGGFSGPTVYLILAYAALPAICEELLFRGILSAEYERHGVSVSILTSTLLFACLHFNFGGFPVYLFSGIVLSITTYFCRSISGAVIAHFIYNLFGLFGQPYLNSLYEITGSRALFVFLPIVLLILSLAIFCGEAARLCKRYAERGLTPIDPPKAPDGSVVPLKVRLKAVLLTPDAACLYAVWLFASILFLFID